MMGINQSFLSRGVNEGYSGGEKKRNEILQMLMLKPTLFQYWMKLIQDLDIDSMKIVSKGINSMLGARHIFHSNYTLRTPASIH